MSTATMDRQNTIRVRFGSRASGKKISPNIDTRLVTSTNQSTFDLIKFYLYGDSAEKIPAK